MNRNVLAGLRLLTVFFFSALLVWVFADTRANHLPASAQRGQLELTDWNFEADGPVKLQGEWEWRWGQLLTPEELKRSPEASREYVQLPASWNSGNEHSAQGFATYRLHISWQGAPQVLALRTSSIATSHRLWIDGVPLGGMGQVGTSIAASQPQDAPRQYLFPAREDGVEIVVQVANFVHRYGGLWETLELGTPQQMQSKHDRLLAFDLVLFGCLFMMAVYHLVLYVMRKRDRSTLYFGLFCLIIALRTMLVGEVFLYELFPQLAWAMRIRLEYWGVFLGLPLFGLFIRELYPKETSRPFICLIIAISLGYTAMTAVVPPTIFTRMLPSYQLVVVASSLYYLITMFRATVRGRKGALLATIGGFVYFISVVNDILYFDELIKTGSYSPLGLFVFVSIHSAVLSMKFSRALSSEELLTIQLAWQAQEVRMLNDQLQELNRGLEAGIAVRTQELQLSNRHLAQKAAEIVQMDSGRRQLLSNISHELRTPMTSIRGYVEALLDDIFVSPEEKRHYLKLILNKMIGLDRLITDLFELSKLESGQPDLQFHSVPVATFLERTRHKYELDVVQSGLRFKWDDAELASLPVHAYVVLDPERIDQVVTNLVANAIRCTPAGGAVGFRFLSREGLRGGELVQELVVNVEDTGSGIGENDLPFLFERFYRGKEPTAGSSGLGLAIAKEIVTHHGGSIWAQSHGVAGSTFGFSLLLYEEDKNL